MTAEQALDINWLKANHIRLYFFGLGFIQVKINDSYRVHFYTNKWHPTVKDEEIHNHRYDFTSTILKGYFAQTIYSTRPGWSHCKVQLTCKPGHMGNMPTVEPTLYVDKLYRCEYGPGSKYTLDHNTFHNVEPAHNTVTLLQTGPYKKDQSDILYLADTTIQCPFSVQVSDEELWEEIERIIND